MNGVNGSLVGAIDFTAFKHALCGMTNICGVTVEVRADNRLLHPEIFVTEKHRDLPWPSDVLVAFATINILNRDAELLGDDEFYGAGLFWEGHAARFKGLL